MCWKGLNVGNLTVTKAWNVTPVRVLCQKSIYFSLPSRVFAFLTWVGVGTYFYSRTFGLLVYSIIIIKQNKTFNIPPVGKKVFLFYNFIEPMGGGVWYTHYTTWFYLSTYPPDISELWQLIIAVCMLYISQDLNLWLFPEVFWGSSCMKLP